MQWNLVYYSINKCQHQIPNKHRLRFIVTFPRDQELCGKKREAFLVKYNYCGGFTRIEEQWGDFENITQIRNEYLYKL